jgi:hypothetical protein
MKIRLSKSKITTKFSQALKLVGTKEIVELNILTKLCHGTELGIEKYTMMKFLVWTFRGLCM